MQKYDPIRYTLLIFHSKFQINDISSGAYTLNVRGTGGLNFQNSTQLEYHHKSYSVFIQTDKAIYKPGDKIMFRVLVLNPNLRPVSTTLLNVYFSVRCYKKSKIWKSSPCFIFIRRWNSFLGWQRTSYKGVEETINITRCIFF